MKVLLLGLFTSSVLIVSTPTLASEAQNTLDKNMNDAKDAYKKIQDQKTREAMRDKSHDGRLPIDKDTSVGMGKDGVNIRKSIP